MDVEQVTKPKPMDYDLSNPDEAQRYRDDTDHYIMTYPDRRPPPPIPVVPKPNKEAYDLTDEDRDKFQQKCEMWNQSAIELNISHGANLPLMDETGNEINDTESQSPYDPNGNGYEEKSQGSKQLLDVPSSITEDYSVCEMDDDVSFIALLNYYFI